MPKKTAAQLEREIAETLAPPPRRAGSSRRSHATMRTPSTGADFDYSAYLGDGSDGMYVDVKQRRDGWYVVATVDSDTGSFVEALPDDGPYKTRAEAAQAAVYRALDWATDNRIKVTKKDQKAAIKFLMTP